MPEYEPQIVVPFGHEAGTNNNIWTPTNVRYIQSWVVGEYHDQDTGNLERVLKHEFELSFMGMKKTFGVMAEESASDAQIEDLAGGVVERTAKQIEEQVQKIGGRLRPEDLAERSNWGKRRDVAGAFREYRKWAKRRRASSTGKTIYKGLV